LADWYYRGRMVALDRKKSFQFYEKSCLYGHAKDCLFVGSRYAVGTSWVDKNLKKATKYYGRACVRFRSALGCSWWGLHLDRGWGTKPNPQRAFKAWWYACGKRISRACIFLGLSFRDGRHRKVNRYKAAYFFGKACRYRDAEGCTLQALLYETWVGNRRFHRKNRKKVNKLYHKACGLGSKHACHNLAINYERGNYVSKNSRKARYFFRRACRKKLGVACFALAVGMRKHLHKKQSKRRRKKFLKIIRRLLRRACRYDHQKACLALQ
ncbi:MAG: tetratricopeptide repeat protein, partial [Myxococcota bacterium]